MTKAAEETHTTLSAELLQQAADGLDEFAHSIANCYVDHDNWEPEDRAQHDDLRRVARELRAHIPAHPVSDHHMRQR